METAQASSAHDLNNLLCKIMGSAELALDLVAEPAARAELQGILNLAEQAGQLVQALAVDREPAR
jgi:hypothetical protein